MTLYGTTQHDHDPVETTEWIDSLEAVLASQGPDRARYLLARLLDRARHGGYVPDRLLNTNYINTIPPERTPAYPGDEAMEERVGDIIRWNAA
ncbi:MAG: pyruvate dehydrogenase (acetyl-transferring), homodimeric type, partial [Planctomycetes bacterium]|nr:pyruvate dehydrogenase (acetyl-transferring), homodimeric type [Planctomycetota bacterium]